jgi:pyruvate kinase
MIPERKAKIVATIGPASRSRECLKQLIEAGMDVARLNFSHGTHDDHATTIRLIRELSQELHKPITILQDLQGPKLRVAEIPGGQVILSAGDTIILSSNPTALESSNGEHRVFIPMDVPNLENSVGPGSRILMDDGKLELTVLDVSPEMVEARVVTGGQLSSHKGVNLPGANLSIPGFTEKDQADLAFGIQQGVDMVAVSFVRIADDIIKVRNRIESLSAQLAATPIIAKIELPEAIKNLHEIIHATDGVMVARGDLGVEMPPASVPTLQKEIILTANRHGKIVITATQMLESMIFSPRPTRAEASDVANAVFDGTDAVMLSGETAAGAYPIESIHMMDLIVRDAENHYDPWGHYHDLPQEADHNDALSITRAARELALDRDVAAIVVFTETGRTALYAAKSRCKVPILAFTPVQQTFQRLSMYWGVTPFLVPYANSVESMIAIVEEASTSLLLLHPGQQIVLISGLPVGAMRQPNFLLLHTIGEDY